MTHRVFDPRWSRAALLALLMASSACSLQRYEARALDRERVPAAQLGARLDDAELGAALKARGAVAEWPLAVWSPAQLALAAVLRSPEVVAAQARVGTALAAQAVAAQGANPGLSLNVEHHGHRDSDQSSHWSVGPSLDFSLSPQSRKRIAVALADTALVAARADVQEEAWQAHYTALLAALDVAEQRARSALLAREATARAAVVAVARAQVAAGLDDAFEWQTLELEANAARLAELDQARERAGAEAALAAALHMPGAALASVELAQAGTAPAPDYQQLQGQALTRHPAVLHALADYDHAEHELALAVAAQYPEVHLSPGYFFDQGDNVWSLVGGVVVPLFATQDAAIRQASAARDAARDHFYAVQTATIGALQSAWAAWQAASQAEQATLAVAKDIEASAAALRAGERDGLVARLVVARAGRQQAEVATRLAGSAALTRRSLAAVEMAARSALDDAPFSAYLIELEAGDARPGAGQP